MQQLLTTAKAFSDPTRIRLLSALRSRELCVCELCDALGLAQSTLSSHLQFLRQAGLVKTRQDGKWVYYELSKTFARTAAALFKLHAAEVEHDPVLRADTRQLEQRLKDRDDGSCCVGFPKAKSKRPRRAALARV